MPIEDAFRLLESDFLRVRSGVPQPSTQVTPLVRQSLSPPRRQPRQLSPTRRQPQRPTSPPVERESRLPSRPHAAEPLSSALSKVVRGGGDDLSADQLSDLIEVLQQKKKAAVGVHSASPVKPREFERGKCFAERQLSLSCHETRVQKLKSTIYSGMQLHVPLHRVAMQLLQVNKVQENHLGVQTGLQTLLPLRPKKLYMHA